MKTAINEARAEQLFVVSAVSRASIAEDVNQVLEDHEMEMRLAPDDACLTDGLCQSYADGLHTLDCNTYREEAYYDAFAEFQEEFITEKLGIKLKEGA